MKILILTSCTGEKRHTPANQLSLDDFRKGADHVCARETELKDLLTPAGGIYTGEQHVRLMRGVAAARAAGIECEVRILSAGYGFIAEDRLVAPYECTFATMKAKDLREWAAVLHAPEGFRAAVAEPYDLGLVLLGDNYLRACALNRDLKFGGPTLLFTGTGPAKRIPSVPNLRVVTLSNPEARRFSCGLVGLKGEIAARILRMVAQGAGLPTASAEAEVDLLGMLDVSGERGTRNQSGWPSGPGGTRPLRTLVSYTPRGGAKMLYFVPDWDDRVDPEYDFTTDTASHGRDPYSHDVYAHEVYGAAPYDGILVSKSVMERNRAKKQRIGEIGVHAHLRVPVNFPVMGDCGAFNYIHQEVPPYETEETVRFYQDMGFDLGVSIDHLIVPGALMRRVYALRHPDGTRELVSEQLFRSLRSRGVAVRDGNTRQPDLLPLGPILETWEEDQPGEAQRRWDITLANSRDFIETHRRLRCTFVPVAGCQGWDVDSHVEMFREQQKMGYQYIGLGGLVRSPTPYILDVLEQVNKLRHPATRVHVFGVARLEAVKAFAEAGVRSVDSASMLRQAWLSATSNYYWFPVPKAVRALKDGEMLPAPYAAVRVPPVYPEGGASPLARVRVALERGADLDTLLRRERYALALIRAFDRGQAELGQAVAAVLEYGQLVGVGSEYEERYRRLLSEAPWRQCPCAVCRAAGIEVVLFRRNNRNRRRGFHNTWWFYQVFRELTL